MLSQRSAGNQMRYENICVDAIVEEKRLRPLSEQKVIELIDSIKLIGLINPLVIRRPSGATPILVAGAHRLAAVRDLGWKEVPCVSVPDQDADQAALVEIDENLVRNDLSPAERAIFISRRKEIYERLCPQAKHGGAPGKAGGGKVA
jgi:ParB family chromosome partitioning protein